MLKHTLGPQVGGFVDPEEVSPKARIVVGTYVESMVKGGKNCAIIVVYEQSPAIVMVNDTYP